MRACSKRYAEGPADEDEWGLVGLLHDFDYEMFPSADQHPFTGANILCGRGYSERFIRAIMGHATYTASHVIQTWPARFSLQMNFADFLLRARS